MIELKINDKMKEHINDEIKLRYKIEKKELIIIIIRIKNTIMNVIIMKIIIIK